MGNIKLKVYNTQRISDEEALQNFIARKKEFKVLISIIQETRTDGPSQHQLIIGQRGMGKTTLLKRLEVELRQDPYNKRFIPLLFPEEQYNLDNLATFWLNCLDAIADIRDIQGAKNDVQELDEEINHLVSMPNIKQRTEKAYRYFCHTTFNLGKIPVLLIDNIDFVFRRLNQEELHVLRAFLTECGAPIVIGASSSPVLETEDYDSPFYDAFQVHYLKKLSSQELLEVMRALANNDNSKRISIEITSHRARLKAINQLTGGNPRTSIILFNQILKGFSDTIVEDLDLILDELTPIYKARYEELSEKQQIIVNAIAMNWDPLSLERIKSLTGLESGQLSPQLKRLVDTGWIEKPLNERYKGGAYELCERMFNIWYLMRRSSRRQKKGVFCLSKYLEAFYENEEELLVWINQLIAGPLTSHHHAITALALAKLSSDKEVRWKLHAKSRAFIKSNPKFIQQIEATDLYDSLEETIQAFEDAVQQNDAQQIIVLSDLLMTIQNKQLLNYIIKNRVIAFIKMQQFEDGIKLLDNHPSITDTASIWVSLAAGVHNTNGPESTIEHCLLQAIASDKSHWEAYLYLGKLYTEAGRLEEADNALEQASMLTKAESMDIMLAKGVLYSLTNRREEGEEYLRIVLSEEKQSIEALFYLGRLLLISKREDYGLSLFETILKLKPESILIRAWRHVADEQLNQQDKSSLLYTDDSLNKRSLVELYRRVASIYSSENMDEWAFQYWKKVIEIDGDDVDSLLSIVQYCLNADLIDDAISYVNNLITIIPNDYRGLFLGSVVYYLQGNVEKAKDLALRAIKEKPSGETYQLLGYIYEHLLEYNEAKQYYIKALEYNMESRGSILRSIGEIERDVFNDYNSAEEYFTTLKEKDPYLLISLYRDYMNRVDEARAIFEAIPRTEEDTTEYKLEQVLFYIQANLLEDADKVLSTIIAKLRNTPELGSFPIYIRRFYCICLRYNCGEWLLQEFDKMGMSEDLAPEYHAIKALVSKNPNAYLDTVALEIREISKSIISQIKRGI